MKNNNIAFIGGGNMASAMIGGLLNSGYSRQQLWVAERSPERRTALKDFGIQIYESAPDLLNVQQQQDCIVLAVKPQGMAEVCRDMRSQLDPASLIISIAAGIRSHSLLEWLSTGHGIALVRAMPNTPALYGNGASGLYASAAVNEEQKALAEHLLSATGIVEWFEREEDLDVVTALSGSGPAYYFRIMEVMIQAAIDMGLEAGAARRLTLQTALGAARMAQQSELDLAQLRKNVTSPGGTTERGLNVMQDEHIDRIFEKVIRAAAKRSVELSQQLAKD